MAHRRKTKHQEALSVETLRSNKTKTELNNLNLKNARKKMWAWREGTGGKGLGGNGSPTYSNVKGSELWLIYVWPTA